MPIVATMLRSMRREVITLKTKGCRMDTDKFVLADDKRKISAAREVENLAEGLSRRESELCSQ